MTIRIRMAGTVIVAAGALLLLGNIAEAHTTISPRQSIAGAMEKYTVRVPAEGQMMAKGAEIEVPEGVTVANFATPAGWTYEVKRQDGRIVKTKRARLMRSSNAASVSTNTRQFADAKMGASFRFR